ncbi:ribonucleases P/MRP protein subunit POP1 [Pieris brassicae]|uniref:Uncharacterized protein n=1 Tax=Pieris brassicae TaxID=7116 RepID=A0A9P0XFE4_PIEBR|nr:ribonucleases P/MRP protein subunit POP1 [Pieris brassicae]CAH4032842.1 unnamed protein product [Pieris brassicae]
MEATEFDASLGGTENLPITANSFKFAASRSIEITAMTESILRPNKTKLIFQSLPVHMRRRVMSHNCKRLPRRLREGHMEQLKKSGLPPKQKRPSRKYRRRPANLLAEYTRRQRRVTWLETHIWHAKRFHMTERWGFRLAHRPCDKAFRACYRATSAHCLLQDISYFVPILIKGSIESIENMFSLLCSKTCGLGVTAKAFISGNRAGSLNIFKPQSYPFGFIGKVEFQWVYTNEIPELLIFVHPSQIKEVEASFSSIILSEDSKLLKDSKRIKLSHNLSDISINVLYGQFNRFRLTGPKSHAILTHSLKTVNTIKLSSEWVSKTKNFDLYLQEKHEYWSNISNLSSPSQLPSRIVIGLIVKDPRWSRPKKRTKAEAVISPTNIEILRNLPKYAPSSPLWHTNVREIIKKNIITNGKFIEHVTKTHSVPGETNEDDPALQNIPVVLIQRPGSQNSTYKKIGYGSGWDIILPSGYGLPFWLTFIMFGARPGGLRETEHLSHEKGETYLCPDSVSGTLEEERIELQLKEHYFKRPPSKRVNFIKLGILSPFRCPWMILLRDWSSCACDNFFILRETNIINELQNCLNRKTPIITSFPNENSCLVAVYLQTEGKGLIKDHAIICMPNFGDFKSNKVLQEPQHEDKNSKIRKEKRLEHRKLLKKIRRAQIKLKKKLTEKITKPKTKSKEPSEYVKSMRDLWLKSFDSVRHACVRQTMGYVTKGAFSFTEAKGCAVGYIAFNALKYLIDSKFNKILVRNTTSNKYSVANIQLINNI